MTWNYRVMRRKEEFAIYEVYYDEDGNVCGYSEKPTFPRGETLEYLREEILRYLEALEEPILDYED